MSIAFLPYKFICTRRKIAETGRTPLLFMDFLGNNNKRVRSQSCASYARQRDLFFQSYITLWEKGLLDCHDDEFEEVKTQKDGFKILEQHFSDLAVRIGFSQPRAHQVQEKHFELQPDTLKMLIQTVLEKGDILPLEDVALKLREIWGYV